MVLTDDDKDSGYSYDGLFVRADRAGVLRHVEELRFTGWVGPQEGDWVVLVAATPGRPIAGGGLWLDGLAAELARRADTVTVAASVRRDRALGLAMWEGGEEIGRYVSAPQVDDFGWELPRAEDADDLPTPQQLADLAALGDPNALAALSGGLQDKEPVGVDNAAEFAVACGRPDAVDDLIELLAAPLDDEEETESERLIGVLDRLGLPRWLVASTSLPRDVPGGPGAAEFVRLGAGRTGAAGHTQGLATSLTRRLRRRRHS